MDKNTIIDMILEAFDKLVEFIKKWFAVKAGIGEEIEG